jgi:hypothetical protein
METEKLFCSLGINALNAELNPICHLQALLGAHHILHVGRIRVKSWKPTLCSNACYGLLDTLGSIREVHVGLALV